MELCINHYFKIKILVQKKGVTRFLAYHMFVIANIITNVKCILNKTLEVDTTILFENNCTLNLTGIGVGFSLKKLVMKQSKNYDRCKYYFDSLDFLIHLSMCA